MAKAGTGIIVTGDKELDRLLRGLPLKVQKKVSRKATRKAAKDIVLPEARNRVGVNFGELQDSLKVKAIKRSRTKFGHEVTTGDGFWKGDQFYGAFLEFGTKERQHESGKQVGQIQPGVHAYLRPAVYDNEPRIVALYVDAMKELINELPAETK